MTSHSHHFVQHLKPEHIYMDVSTEDSAVAFKRLRADRVRDFCAAAVPGAVAAFGLLTAALLILLA